jgi:predicted TIM-barrel fold metal-dependent hydrolase
VRFIVAHGGPGAPAVGAADIASTRDNVFLEFASSFASLPAVRASVERVGPDRLLFGSDAPLLDPAFVLGTYREAGIPRDRLGDVFAGTARRLFGLAA